MHAATGQWLKFKAFHGALAALIAILADEEGAQGNGLARALARYLERPELLPDRNIFRGVANEWEYLLYIFITCKIHFDR